MPMHETLCYWDSLCYLGCLRCAGYVHCAGFHAIGLWFPAQRETAFTPSSVPVG